MNITDDDLPAFYSANDRASAWAQSWYLCLTRLHLGLLVAVAVVSGFTAKLQTNQRYLAYAIAVLIAMAFVVAIAKRALRFEQRWYHFRALAESAKSAAWRYMMHSPADDEEARATDELFTGQIKGLAERFPDLVRLHPRHSAPGPEISERMREVQAMGLSGKLDVYREDRLIDQRDWYRRRSSDNRCHEILWFAVMLLAQAAVLVCAVAHAWCLWRFNPVGALSALAAVFVAWTQTKRHADLVSSYGAAAQDLNLLDSLAESVATQDQLEEFVEDVESACSREHSLWLVRRGG